MIYELFFVSSCVNIVITLLFTITLFIIFIYFMYIHGNIIKNQRTWFMEIKIMICLYIQLLYRLWIWNFSNAGAKNTLCKVLNKRISFYSYTIEDLAVERQFRVSMTLKACFEASDDAKCLVNIDIFKNSLLPKSICDWTAGFSTPSKTISRYRLSGTS